MMSAIVETINSAGRVFVAFSLPMLIQSGLLVVILLLVDLLLRRKVRAVFRYWMWTLVLVKLVLPVSLGSPVSVGTWFGGTLAAPLESRRTEIAPTDVVGPSSANAWQPQSQVGDGLSRLDRTTPQAVGEESINDAGSEPVPNVAPSTPIPSPAPATSLSWQGVVFLIWAVAAAALLLLLLQRAAFVRELAAQTDPAPAKLITSLDECRRRMGAGRVVSLRVSPYANSPAVCGLLRPAILIPQGLATKLQTHEVRAVLMHELAHIKRGDLWVNVAQTLLQIVYFYNPLLWVANAMIRRVREQAVDETVLVALGDTAQEYPQTLVNIARLALTNRPALSLRLIGVVESKSALTARVKHILTHPIPKSARLGLLGLTVLVATGAILLPMAKGRSNKESNTLTAAMHDNPAGSRDSEPNAPAALTITLSKWQMLDLARAAVVYSHPATFPEDFWREVEASDQGDLLFDYPMLYLIRGATTTARVDTVTGPLKGHRIDQSLPENLIVTTREGRRYKVTIQSTSGYTCALEYSLLSSDKDTGGGALAAPNVPALASDRMEPMAAICEALSRWMADARSGRLDAMRRAYAPDTPPAGRDLENIQKFLASSPDWEFSPVTIAAIDGAGIAISGKHGDPAIALVWSLKGYRGGWAITEVRVENPEDAKQASTRFFQSHPGALWYIGEKASRANLPGAPNGFVMISLDGKYWRLIPDREHFSQVEGIGPPGEHALSFDGIDDCLIVPPSPSSTLKPPFTVEVWIKPDFSNPKFSGRSTLMSLVRQGKKVDNPPQVSCYQQGGFVAFLYPPTELEGEVSGAAAVREDRGTARSPEFAPYAWPRETLYGKTAGAFMAAHEGGSVSQTGVFSGNDAPVIPGRPGWTHIYIESPAIPWVLSPDRSLVIGQNIASYGVPYKGCIAEIRVWSKNLNRTERVWYGARPLTGNEPNLVACWTFSEGSGQIVHDLSPNHNDAHLGNSTGVDDADPGWVDSSQDEASKRPAHSNDASVGGVLELLVAPKPDEIDAAKLEEYKKSLDAGELSADAQFAWFELDKDLGLNSIQFVMHQHDGRSYVLLHNREPFALLLGQGWRLLKASQTTDASGRGSVSLEFDDKGGEIIYTLTKANIGHGMAILIDGHVVAAPAINAAISREAIIQGTFTDEQLRQIVAALRKGISTPSAEEPAEPKKDSGALGFRIAPRADEVGSDVVEQCKRALTEGKRPPGGGFAWFEVQPSTVLVPDQITCEHDGETYLLLWDDTPHRMLADGTWKLREVQGTPDQAGGRAVQLTLDEKGAQLLHDFTQANSRHYMAILVESRVVSIPFIASALFGAEVQIIGRFSAEDVDQVMAALSKEVIAPSASGAAPQEIIGAIFDPNGKPVGGAQVALSTEKTEVVIENGKLELRPTDGAENGKVVETNDDGLFRFGDTPSGTFDLIAAHRTGFALIARDELLKNRVVRLEKWGQIEGQLAKGRQALENRISLSGLPDSSWLQNKRAIKYETRCGADGRFVFEKVPAGWVEVGYLTRMGETVSSITARTPVVVKAGETTMMRLAGEGRPVIGRFVPPAGYSGPVYFGSGLRSLATSRPDPPRPANYNQMSQREQQDWYNQWRKTPEAKAYYDALWHNPNWRQYTFRINSDGSFRIEDVIPGKYDLTVWLEEEPTGQGRPEEIGAYNGKVEVPAMTDAYTDYPLDLGNLALSMNQPPVRVGDIAPSVFVTDAGLAWQRTDRYVPPDANGFFPDDPEGGKKLDTLFGAVDKDRRSDAEILSTVRQGFRRTTQYHSLILAWVGNRYIWGRDPQNAEAIEIMYHAVPMDRHEAVYFGLSVVKNKTPNVLRTLADLCMTGQEVGRITWGVGAQRDDLVACIRPYLSDADPARREIAGVLIQHFEGKLDFEKWQDQKRLEHARAEYGPKLPQLRQQLLTGDSAVRHEAFQTIVQNQLHELLDDSFLAAMKASARDADADVRNDVARVAGQRWVWDAQVQNQDAIAIMLELTRDANREVRYNAVYFGLSVVRDKNEPVVRRLVELALADHESDPYGRIVWGLKGPAGKAPDSFERILAGYADQAGSDFHLGASVFLLYRDVVAKEPPEGWNLAAAGKHYFEDLFTIIFSAKEPFQPDTVDALWREFTRVLPAGITAERMSDRRNGATIVCIAKVRGTDAADTVRRAIEGSPQLRFGQVQAISMQAQLYEEEQRR